MKLSDFTKFVTRAFLFLLTLCVYAIAPEALDVRNWPNSPYLWVLLTVFAIDYFPRFSKNNPRHIGSTKQFAENYSPKRTIDPVELKRDVTKANRNALKCAVFFLAIISVFYVLYWVGILDAGFMMLLTTLFAVADSVFILFFCPFRAIIQKTRCCSECRIYNWDMIMNVLPIAVVPSIFTAIHIIPAIAYFAIWETNFHKHPERFLSKYNRRITCAACTCTCATCPRQRRSHVIAAAITVQDYIGRVAVVTELQLGYAAVYAKEQLASKMEQISDVTVHAKEQLGTAIASTKEQISDVTVLAKEQIGSAISSTKEQLGGAAAMAKDIVDQHKGTPESKKHPTI